MVELGYPDFVAEIFTALLAPAGTPPEVVIVLIAEVGKLLKDPALIEKAERAGYEWIGAGPDALQRKMAEEKAQIAGGHPVLRHQAAVTADDLRIMPELVRQAGLSDLQRLLTPA